MRIDVVTLFPELVRPVAEAGVVGRAVADGKLSLATWNPRDYASDRHRTVDDRPYGGGPGMVMAIEPLRSAIVAAREADQGPVKTSLMSPQGRVLDQAALKEMASRERLLLVCGRYEGIDQRLIDAQVDEQWSLGDYVLSGGELAAAVIIDAVGRLLPGVLGHNLSAEQDSFSDGLLDCPHYTRPETSDGDTVPAVLLSGDHAAIARWRRMQALGSTWRQRPELLEEERLDDHDRQLLEEYRQGFGKNDKAAG